MNLAFIAFSERGKQLADRLAEALGGTADRCGEGLSLSDWTAGHFSASDGLVFVGAAGIAVRAVAPYVKSKASDPAVVVVDERGTYAIPLLSGHLGGANELARRISGICGAEAVITTATDRNGVFAVDEWARIQGCAIPDPEGIKAVSARLLAGGNIRIRSDWRISGEPPAGVSVTDGTTGGLPAGVSVTDGTTGELPQDPDACPDVRLTLRPAGPGPLYLVPRILTLGIGCRKGVPGENIEAFFRAFMARSGLHPAGIGRVCSIDRKAEEPGILSFCRARHLPFHTYSAAQLAAVPGRFTASERVLAVTGVDNVCERSAVLGAGEAAESLGAEAGAVRLLCPKEAENGITLAVAAGPFTPDWRWQYE